MDAKQAGGPNPQACRHLLLADRAPACATAPPVEIRGAIGSRDPIGVIPTFREFLYPGLKRVVEGFKELGLLVIKHTDGQVWPILDMIVDSGIDCFDPIDPVAKMDLGEVKAKYGDRIALKGNVDCARTLTFGTVKEVVEETQEWQPRKVFFTS